MDAVARNVNLLSRLRHFCNSEACNTFFFTRALCPELIMSVMYGIAAVMYISKNLKLFTNVQSKFFVLLRSIKVNWTRAHLYGPLPLIEHLQYNKCILVHKVMHNKSPQYLRQLVHNGARNDHSSQNNIFMLPKTRIDIYKMSFAYSGSFCWNALPRNL